MKKIFFYVVMVLVSSVSALAQPQPGTFSITPKVGFSLNTLSGDEPFGFKYEVADVDKYNSNYNDYWDQWQEQYPEEEYVRGIYLSFDKPQYGMGFVGGFDVQYQFSARWAIVGGFNYSYRKSSYDVESCTTSFYGKHPNFSWQSKSLTYKMYYFQIPILAKCYLYKGLAVHAGIEMSVLRQAKREYKWQVKFDEASTYFLTDNKFDYWTSYNAFYSYYYRQGGQYYDFDEKTRLTKEIYGFDFSIPMGFSYEFGHFVTDARVDYGLCNLSKVKGAKCRNLAFSLSFGYRFDL